MTLLYIFSLLLIVYTYAGYYLVLFLIFYWSGKEYFIENNSTNLPQVSFLIAAYNEEKNILAKIHNIFESNYPQDKISVYIVSDASTDRTNELVTSFDNERVQLIVSPCRQGKTLCENLGLKAIDTDIIIFSDASAMLDKECIHHLVKHFNLKNIGCVSTRDKSIESDVNKGENLYVKYEMAIRSMESKVDSLVGLSGSCYAARRKLCTELPDYVTRDFALPLIARENGYQSIDEPQAVCYVKPTDDHKKEFARKIRTFTNGIFTLFYKLELLNIFKYRKFAFILWSHKVFRWLLPLFFMVLLLTNFLLFKVHFIYKATLLLQVSFYSLAVWGRNSNSDNIFTKISKIFHFLCMTNIATIMAWYNFFIGNRWVKWEPTKR